MNIIEINGVMNNDDVIYYWHEEFQLTKEDENILLNPNGWLSDQHLEQLCKYYIKKNKKL
jgi:hypothetical protein